MFTGGYFRTRSLVPLYATFYDATELIMAVGLVVDYTVHIVHYFLHQVGDKKSETAIPTSFPPLLLGERAW